MSYLLLHGDAWSPAPLARALEAAQVETRVIGGASDLGPNDRPTAFVLDADSRAVYPLETLRAFVDAGGAIVALGRKDEADVPDGLPTELLTGFVPQGAGLRQLLVAIRAGFREAAARAETARARKEALQRGSEVAELARIGAALGTERDLKKLLHDILTQARRITQSDAGSLYLVETNEVLGVKRLRFLRAQNDSKPDMPFDEKTFAMDRTSLAGHTAVTGEHLVIEDAYTLPPNVEYRFDRSFDEQSGYRTKSMLVIPMKDHKEQMIGVLQLINRKRSFDVLLVTPEDVERQVVTYSRRTQELVTAFAGQAAVAIENGKLYEKIEKMFERFVDAAVLAIEQRDPITQGHSRRVANKTVRLAEVVDGAREGPFRDTHFSPEHLRTIKYAGLLHDFGKVGVPEEVLQKEKKLYPRSIDVIRQRHAFIVRTAEREFWRRQAEYLRQRGGEEYDGFLDELKETHRKELAELDRFLEIVVRANEPKLLAGEVSGDLLGFAKRTYESLSGDPLPLLTPDEVRFLTIPKGSLDDAERKQIEEHVNHTYRFLKQIPWPPELERVPEIAFGHHEKLNGTGYPLRIAGDDILLETRMMTISDIYDALTAADRPYKKEHNVGPDLALSIMDRELVKAGQLDDRLFRLFVEAKVFETPTATT